jgi:hypothetical protein
MEAISSLSGVELQLFSCIVHKENKRSITHARFVFTGSALAGALYRWTRLTDRVGSDKRHTSVASLKTRGLCAG